MHKFLLMIATLLLFSTVTAFTAPDDSEEGGDEEEETTFECSDDPDVGSTCTCETGKGACGDMIEEGVCSSDIWCRDISGGERYCICDWAAPTRGGTSRRPDAFTPATENAPRSDDIVAPNNRSTGRRSETVPARRGGAPRSDTVIEEERNEPANRNVRDHRSSGLENRQTEDMRREEEELERQLQELEGGGGS